jgi:hypothetical protein
LAQVREIVLPKIERHGPVEAWIIDDTGLPKKGRHSVGVARQYCGQLGKEDNCQVAVSLSIANEHASLPVAYRLYLPREWTEDRDRLRKAGVPEGIGFKTKHEIALEQLRWACAAGLSPGVVLLDAGYGNNSSRTPRCGQRGRDRCRRRGGPAADGRQSACGAMPSIGRSRLKTLRSACPKALGAQSSGEKVRPRFYPRALLGCGCVLRGVTSGVTRCAQRNGS